MSCYSVHLQDYYNTKEAIWVRPDGILCVMGLFHSPKLILDDETVYFSKNPFLHSIANVLFQRFPQKSAM